MVCLSSYWSVESELELIAGVRDVVRCPDDLCILCHGSGEKGEATDESKKGSGDSHGFPLQW